MAHVTWVQINNVTANQIIVISDLTDSESQTTRIGLLL